MAAEQMDPEPAVERLAYSPAELAAALGCTRVHVHNLIARGELRSIKLGRRRLIPRTVVDELLLTTQETPPMADTEYDASIGYTHGTVEEVAGYLAAALAARGTYADQTAHPDNIKVLITVSGPST